MDGRHKQSEMDAQAPFDEIDCKPRVTRTTVLPANACPIHTVELPHEEGSPGTHAKTPLTDC